MSRFTRVRAGAAFLLCLALSTPAYAHAQLRKATPGAGATVAGVSELKLEFSEGVEPKFTSVAVTERGGAVPEAKTSVEAGDNKILTVKFVSPLAPGVYTVTWKAVATDTHRTQGAFNFTVRP